MHNATRHDFPSRGCRLPRWKCRHQGLAAASPILAPCVWPNCSKRAVHTDLVLLPAEKIIVTRNESDRHSTRPSTSSARKVGWMFCLKPIRAEWPGSRARSLAMPPRRFLPCAGHLYGLPERFRGYTCKESRSPRRESQNHRGPGRCGGPVQGLRCSNHSGCRPQAKPSARSRVIEALGGNKGPPPEDGEPASRNLPGCFQTNQLPRPRPFPPLGEWLDFNPGEVRTSLFSPQRSEAACGPGWTCR